MRYVAVLSGERTFAVVEDSHIERALDAMFGIPAAVKEVALTYDGPVTGAAPGEQTVIYRPVRA